VLAEILQESENDEVAEGRPERTCAGCRAQAESSQLIRFAFVPGHEPPLVPDLQGRLGGRGVWVHAQKPCLIKATRGGFARSLKQGVKVQTDELLQLMQGQVERRIQGLLLAALRRREVAVGTDAVMQTLATCPVRLLLVAKDAAGRRNDVVARASERRVRVLELFDKESLGRLTQRESLSFVAVLESQIAAEIVESARWLAGLSEDG
jgi:predicted RNA-binding protein YlxR (DUF448 family)